MSVPQALVVALRLAIKLSFLVLVASFLGCGWLRAPHSFCQAADVSLAAGTLSACLDPSETDIRIAARIVRKRTA